MTRRGRMMRVVLDDRSASEELAVFSEQYELNRSLLKEDELIVVHGKVSKDDYTGGYRFSASASSTWLPPEANTRGRSSCA
jgi:DNA polymerase-3 subunit alpha